MENSVTREKYHHSSISRFRQGLNFYAGTKAPVQPCAKEPVPYLTFVRSLHNRRFMSRAEDKVRIFIPAQELSIRYNSIDGYSLKP